MYVLITVQKKELKHSHGILYKEGGMSQYVLKEYQQFLFLNSASSKSV